MTRRAVLPMESYELVQYAVQVPCFICEGGNAFDAELCRHCHAPMALAYQANVQKAPPKMIAALGYNVMVTSHLRYFRLADYFLGHRKSRIAFLLSVHNLHSVFNDKYYEGLDGGMLQAIAKLFACDAKLLAYPNLTPEGH